MALSIPDFQSIYVFFLFLPALLGRLLVADLAADFLQNPLLKLITKEKKQALCYRHEIIYMKSSG